MPSQLLPASAKAFSARSKPNVVLNTRVETWLTQTLKRINRQKRPLNNVSQHRACLEETLAGESAIWSLASIMLPRAPKAELVHDDNPLVEALFHYQLLHVDGYVVHVDMVSQHEVAFKLTKETINALIDYHKNIFSVDAAAEYSYDWPEKDRQIKKLQDDFVQAVNRYVFRTNARALEGLEEEGAGELLEGRSYDVRVAVEHLFQPLLPPPPKIIDVFAPPMMGHWMQQHWYLGQPVMAQYVRPAEPWRVLGSTPSPTTTHAEARSNWSTPAYAETHMTSPLPAYTQPYTTSAHYAAMPVMVTQQLPAQPLPLPSQLIGQCGTSAGTAGLGSYWAYNDMSALNAPYPISI